MFDKLLGPIGSIVGDVLGGIGSSAIQARSSRYLRRTAYKDTMDSMRAAGLNPILAYSQGPINTVSTAPNMSGTVSTAAQVAINRKTLQLLDQQTQKSKYEAKTAREHWIKNQMYNKNILAYDLASAKARFEAERLDFDNQAATSRLINKYKPSLMHKIGEGADTFIDVFKKNFEEAYDHYFNKEKRRSGASGGW